MLPICEHALQQNETLNIFQDELSLMDDDDALAAGAKGESGVRTLANFMDLAYTYVHVCCGEGTARSPGMEP